MKLSAEGISLQRWPVFVFLIGAVTDSEGGNIKVTLKKCCPKGQELNSALMCVNTTRDLEYNKKNNTEEAEGELPQFSNNPSKIFFPDDNDAPKKSNFSVEEFLSWFPFASLISSVTLERVSDWGSIKELFEEANFELGSRPECDPDEAEFSCFGPKYSEQFYLILFPERNIELYISKKSSYHQEGHFKVENRDCGFSKIDPGENKARGKGTKCSYLGFYRYSKLDPRERIPSKEKLKFFLLTESSDLLEKPLFNSRLLRTFPVEDFCLDKGPGERFLVKYCPCKSVPCVRKCCKDSEIYDRASSKCVRNSTFGFWRPRLENSTLTKNYYLLSNRFPSSCEKSQLLKLPPTGEINSRGKCGSQQEERNKFHFLSDGSLQVKHYDVPAGSYCGDHGIYDSKLLLENNFLVCPPDDDMIGEFRVYRVFFLIGGFILGAAVAVSLCVPELRSLAFDKMIIAHNVALALGDLVWGLTSLILPYDSHELCAFSSLTIQFTLLASFFWMNALCWDLFLATRCFSDKEEDRKFAKYAVYACGVPFVVSCITAALEFAPSLLPHYVRPGFDCYCGFDPDSLSIVIYLYGPMTGIFLVDLILYFWTVVRVLKAKKDKEGDERNVCGKRFVTFTKFFLLVGFSWLLEIVGWGFRGKNYYWYFPDFLSALRAVFVFVILVWKGKVFQRLMDQCKGSEGEKDERGQNSFTESDLAEMKRREKILRKQITQTFKISEECEF